MYKNSIVVGKIHGRFPQTLQCVSANNMCIMCIAYKYVGSVPKKHGVCLVELPLVFLDFALCDVI